MWELEQKTEHRRIDAFKLCHWRRFLGVLLTARSNQSILKEIDPEYSLQGLKLKLQYFGHLMRRADSLEKNLMLGKTEGRRRRGWQRTKCLEGITDSMDMNLNKLREIVKDGSLVCCSPWGHKESDMTEQLNKNIFHSWCPRFRLSVMIGRCSCYCSWIWGLFFSATLHHTISPQSPRSAGGNTPRALLFTRRAHKMCPHWSWS